LNIIELAKKGDYEIGETQVTSQKLLRWLIFQSGLKVLFWWS